MSPLCLWNIQGFKFEIMVVFLLIELAACQSSSTDDMPRNILAVQLNEYCDSTNPSSNALFDGGEEFFVGKFDQLISEVKAQLSELVLLTIAQDRPAPNRQVSNAYGAIRAVDERQYEYIADMRFVLGDGLRSNPVYCYDSGRRKISCSSGTYDYKELMKTALDLWFYRFDCDGWKAIFYANSIMNFPQSGKLNK